MIVKNIYEDSVKQCYFCFFDILGFKNMVLCNQTNIQILGESLAVQFKASLLCAIYDCGIDISVETNMIFPKANKQQVGINYYQFSDSVLIFTDDDSSGSFEKLIRVCNIFCAKALSNGFPLRGAISKGEMFINSEIILGAPLLEAYMAEGKVNWAGIIILDNVISTLSKDHINDLVSSKLMVDYEIPLKETTNAKAYCINWPNFAGKYIVPPFKQYFLKWSNENYLTDEVIVKINNTNKFFNEFIGMESLPRFSYLAMT